MTEQNAHRDPDDLPRLLLIGICVFVVLQIVLSIKFWRVALDFVQHGDMSPVSFLCGALSVFFMVLATALLLAKVRVTRYLFWLSAAFSFLVLLQWRPSHNITLLTISCLGIALFAGTISPRLMQSRAKV